MNKPKVSVIVPIHNAGSFLVPCLESLKFQTLQDIEFLLILDCPTDGSDVIADSYAKDDNRFIVIKNAKNLHIGESRNLGMKLARGEYIGFCDHDDYCKPEMYETLYNAASNNNADICLSYLWHRTDRNGEFDEYFQFPTDGFDPSSASNAIIADYPMKKKPSYNNIRSVWLQIIKSSYARNHNICFVDTKKSTFEDIYFCAIEFLFNPRVVVVPQYLYCWISNPRSASKTSSYLNSTKVIHFNEDLYDALVHNEKNELYFSAIACGLIRRLYTMTLEGGMHSLSALRKSRQLCGLIRGSAKKFYKIKGLPPTKWAFYWVILVPLAHLEIKSK